jgi:hypothetical protein
MPRYPDLPITRFLRLALVLGAVGAAAVAVAQPANPRVGTWVNKDNPTNIMTYETAPGGGLKVTVENVNRSGQKTTWWYVTMLDGKDAPITGDPGRESAAVRPLDDRTNEIVYKKGGQPTQIATNVISADGQTLTVTFRTPEGRQTAVATYGRK